MSQDAKPIPDHWEVLSLKSPTLPPATHTNTLLFGAPSFVVVDPGSHLEEEQGKLHRRIQERLDNGEHCAGVVLTHHHFDHCAGLPALLTCLPPQSRLLFAHAETLSRVAHEGWTAHALTEGDVVAQDALEQRLLVCFTPGHAPGHVALHEPATQLMMIADIVASVGTIIVSPPDGDMSLYLDTLRRLSAMSLRQILPSHGTWIDDPSQKLEDYIAHRLKREALVRAALSTEPRTLAGLVPDAYPELHPRFYGLAEHSLLAHLLKLKTDGVAVHNGAGWELAMDNESL